MREPLCSPDSATRHRLSLNAPLSARAVWNFRPPSTSASNFSRAGRMCRSRACFVMMRSESASGRPDFRYDARLRQKKMCPSSGKTFCFEGPVFFSTAATSTTTMPRSVRRSTACMDDEASMVPFVDFPFAS